MQIKKMTSLVLAAMISLSLAACGSSQTTAATSGQTSQQQNLLRMKAKQRYSRQKLLRKTKALLVRIS